ncbi:MAG: hypothetical protein HIU91_10075 [Acidobacteria bacterium]|nr:hypothetical protein [Acidobacteriota bacterium]
MRNLSAPVDRIDQVRTAVTRAELQAHYQNVFYAVVAEYVNLKALSPVVASIVDPDGIGKSTKLNYDAIHYIVDIEFATTKALENRLDLQAAWFCLASGEAVAPKLARETITRCGRLYAARKLAPWYYHKSNRYTHRSTR